MKLLGLLSKNFIHIYYVNPESGSYVVYPSAMNDLYKEILSRFDCNVSLYDIDPKGDWNLRRIRETGPGADKCVGCGACEAACPQHLNIIDSLKDAWRDLDA